jgi:Putative MetA-pathway of phenol degradation
MSFRYGLLVASLVFGCDTVASAQELEPGAYAAAPIRLNLGVVTNTVSFGDLAFDPAVPIEDASATMNFTTLGYGRTLALVGRSANVSIGVPIVAGHLEGRLLGNFAEADRFGMGDPRARIAINLYGAPAMDAPTFVKVNPRRLVGASLTIGIPLGQYSPERLINIGSNRWAFKPEVGVVNGFGRWTIESYGGVWLFTRNSDFYGGRVRTQDPIGSMQFHVHYVLNPRLLLSGNMNFYVGGRTTVNGTENLDLQRNMRVGATLSRPLSAGQVLRVAASHGAITTIGAAFTSVSVAFQQVWGGR